MFLIKKFYFEEIQHFDNLILKKTDMVSMGSFGGLLEIKHIYLKGVISVRINSV